LLQQLGPYIPFGQPGHWTQEINYILHRGRPLKVHKLPIIDRYVLRQALLWQLDRLVPYKAIEDLLWGNDPEGGPLGARSVIGQWVLQLRKEGCIIEVWNNVGLVMRSK